jgi:predicted outer membrane protein
MRSDSISYAIRSLRSWLPSLLLLIFAWLLLPGRTPFLAAEENGPATQQQPAKVSRSDRSFLRQAAQENQAAMELGQVVEQKGFSAAARNFAHTLVAQRSRAQQQLFALARRVHMALPLKLSRHDRKTRQQLEKTSGPRIDNIFLAHMATDLDRQYGNYEDTAMTTKNPEIKQYIESLLSEVKRQDQLANAMAPGQKRDSESEQ